MNLELLGWNSTLAYNFEPYAQKGYSVGRITLEYRGEYSVYSELGYLCAKISCSYYCIECSFEPGTR